MHDIAKFISGFRRFQEGYFCNESELFEKLRLGQSPRAVIIACSDSRVDPAILTGSEPGDLFAIRNVANLVPPYERDKGIHGVSAALEYAVTCLEVDHVIVLGHSQCGGIKALLDGATGALGDDSFIHRWVSIADAAKRKVLEELPNATPDQLQRALEQAAILVSLDNLLGFPWIWERVADERLALHGWYFDMQRGELLSYLPQTGSFEALAGRCDRRDMASLSPESVAAAAPQTPV
jgi:carbonic anhydrase